MITTPRPHPSPPLLVEAAARTIVVWPSGRHAPVPASTLYRWLARYQAHPSLEEDTAAVVALLRGGAGRWGLPEFFSADRGAAYDAYVVRKGCAVLGVRRIPTRSRNAPARGKIEAYQRVLKRWFVKELRHQVVRDRAHLQELFDAWVEETYHAHAHRDVGRPRGQVLGGRRSPRLVSRARLREAFLEERVLKPQLRDGTVRVAARLWRVPGWGPGSPRSVRIAIDPEDPQAVFLVVAPGRLVPLFPLWRRIGVRVTLTGLVREELGSFLAHVLGKEAAARFTPEAPAALSESARGVPALVQSYALECLKRKSQGPITAEDVGGALDGLDG